MHTHVFRRCSLQVHGSAEELLQDGEDPIALKEALQAAEESQDKLDFSPSARVEMIFNFRGRSAENLLGRFWLLGIDDEDDSGYEWDLEGLLVDSSGRVSIGNPAIPRSEDEQLNR